MPKAACKDEYHRVVNGRHGDHWSDDDRRASIYGTAGETIQDGSEGGQADTECQSAEFETHGDVGAITDGVLQGTSRSMPSPSARDVVGR